MVLGENRAKFLIISLKNWCCFGCVLGTNWVTFGCVLGVFLIGLILENKFLIPVIPFNRCLDMKFMKET